MGRYLVFDVGCMECGESSGVVGIYATEDEAKAERAVAMERWAADWHGQHDFLVIDLANPKLSQYAAKAVA